MFCECVCFFFSSECSSLSHTRAYPTHLYLEQCFEGNGVEKIAIIQPLRPDIRPMITFPHKTIFPKSRVVQRCFSCTHPSSVLLTRTVRLYLCARMGRDAEYHHHTGAGGAAGAGEVHQLQRTGAGLHPGWRWSPQQCPVHPNPRGS